MDVSTELDEVEHGILKASMTAELVRVLIGIAATVALLLMMNPELRLAVTWRVNQWLYGIRYEEWMRRRRKVWNKLPPWAQEAGEVRGLKPK